MSIDLILLDLDGVVCDFVSGAFRAHASGLRHDDVRRWKLYELMRMDEDRFWRVIDELGESFWTGLEPYDWARDLVGLCRAHAPELCVSTSNSTQGHSASGKVAWMRAFFGDRFRDYMIGPRKRHFSRRGTVLVDDSDDNCVDFVAGGREGKCVLFPQPWNLAREFTGDRLGHVKRTLEALS